MKKEIEEIINKTKMVISVASTLNVSRQIVYKWLNHYQKSLGNNAFFTLVLNVKKALKVRGYRDLPIPRMRFFLYLFNAIPHGYLCIQTYPKVIPRIVLNYERF